MIYQCPSEHVCFTKDKLDICGVKGCLKRPILMHPANIEWFHRINKDGLCINKSDLHMIVEDPNMPKDVKKSILKIFFNLK